MRTLTNADAAEQSSEPPFIRRTRSDEATDKIEISEWDVEIDISAFEEPSWTEP